MVEANGDPEVRLDAMNTITIDGDQCDNAFRAHSSKGPDEVQAFAAVCSAKRVV